MSGEQVKMVGPTILNRRLGHLSVGMSIRLSAWSLRLLLCERTICKGLVGPNVPLRHHMWFVSRPLSTSQSLVCPGDAWWTFQEADGCCWKNRERHSFVLTKGEGFLDKNALVKFFFFFFGWKTYTLFRL